MSKKSNNGKPKPAAKKSESLRSIYARVRREFSAKDLQKYTDNEPTIPAAQLLAELESIHRTTRPRRRAS